MTFGLVCITMEMNLLVWQPVCSLTSDVDTHKDNLSLLCFINLQAICLKLLWSFYFVCLVFFSLSENLLFPNSVKATMTANLSVRKTRIEQKVHNSTCKTDTLTVQLSSLIFTMFGNSCNTSTVLPSNCKVTIYCSVCSREHCL